MMFIDDFTEDQQKLIFEAEYDDWVQDVHHYFSEDVQFIVIDTMTRDIEWSMFEMRLPSTEALSNVYLSYQKNGEPMRSAQSAIVCYNDEHELTDASLDLDGLPRVDWGVPMHLMMDYVGLTIEEALVLHTMQQLGTLNINYEQYHVRAVYNTRLVDYDCDDLSQMQDVAQELLVDVEDNPNDVVGDDYAPMFAGVRPIRDYVQDHPLHCTQEYTYTELYAHEEDVNQLTEIMMSISDKLHTHATKLRNTIASRCKEEYDYRTSFEAWLEHVTCNDIEFDPECYDIQIEESANV